MSNRFNSNQEIEICRLYAEDHLSTYKLAEQFQCDHSTILRLIKRNGFKTRSLSETNKGRFGVKNNNWKGGRKYHRGGYVCILKHDHPNADMWGYVLEHRLVMEKHLNRFLNPKEVIHHINDIRDDNRIENLMLFGGFKDHFDWHKAEKRETRLLQKDFCV